MLEIDGWYVDGGFTNPGATRCILEGLWRRGPVWKQPRVSHIHGRRRQRFTLKHHLVPELHRTIPRDTSGDVFWKENIEL